MRRWPIAALFTVAGVLHFVIPNTYARIVPPYLPDHLTLVYISGIAEIAGGIGVLISQTRRAAAWGLLALLVAVFPANVYMAQARLMHPTWAGWARLPLQPLLMWWVWWACR